MIKTCRTNETLGPCRRIRDDSIYLGLRLFEVWEGSLTPIAMGRCYISSLSQKECVMGAQLGVGGFWPVSEGEEVVVGSSEVG